MDTSKMSTFQIVLLSILGVCAVVGLAVFAIFRPGTANISNVVIWGTIPATSINSLLENQSISSSIKENNLQISYVQKSEYSIDDELLKAMAIGQGPDAVILRDDQILSYADRTIPIPYESLPLRDFKDTYIQGAELYIKPEGIAALPFMVDPMVMYYNRDVLTSANIATPPQYWQDVIYMIENITLKNVQNNIFRSAVALGTYGNINNAKEIVSMLLLQAGSPIVERDVNSGVYRAVLSRSGSGLENYGDRAVSFYTQFADQLKNTYTWNSSLPNSRDYFISGKLGLYFGPASEYSGIREQNPNLNFDVAPVPQTDNIQTKVTFGHMYGMAILKSSANMQATFGAISLLSSPQIQSIWSGISGLPPVTRALLAQRPSDPYLAIFYNSALQSRAWLDPNRSGSDQVFGALIRSVNSGESRAIEATRIAESALNQLMP